MTSIDIKFNMFFDTPEGKDPDECSKTLNSYHQKLWSKKLPNGKMMHLEQGRDGKRLIVKAKEISKQHPEIDPKHFIFSSDALGLTFKNWQHLPEIKKVFQNLHLGEHEKNFKKCCTIGGYTIFPGKRINGLTINAVKGGFGTNEKICDRIDLTLECIRLFYLNKPDLSEKTCPLLGVFKRYKPFFDLFESFQGYVEYFLFQDLVNNDFSEVRFLHPFHGFNKAYPKNLKEYRAYMKKMIKFIELRNSRILDWATNH